MDEPNACACSEEVLLCEHCRATAIGVADATAQMCDGTRANAVNEIEFSDPFTGRAAMVRRDASGQWYVADVRRLGSAERARGRPPVSSA